MKKTLILENLDCASCADKVASRLEKEADILAVDYSFVTKKFVLTLNKKLTLDKLRAIITEIEPDLKVEEHKPKHHHEHTHDTDAKSTKILMIKLAIALTLFGAATLLPINEILRAVLYLLAYVIIGGDVLLKAGRNILRGDFFDENFLMSIATIGAIGLRDFAEATAVMLFYQVGELFQAKAVENSRKSIAGLMDIRPDFANVVKGDQIEKVHPLEVQINDEIIVKPGEKIPLDGTVIAGDTFVDNSALTGESLPLEIHPGDSVLSGTINQTSVIRVQVNKEFGQSTVAKILELVENAGTKKAPTEKFITKFSKVYTPIVVALAILLAIVPTLLFGFEQFPIWLERALIFLVISCPCALVVSIPLGFFGGIGASSKRGILVKGGNYLEALTNVQTVLFDKTGTLTQGKFSIESIDVAQGVSKDELLKMASYVQWYSTHPIAKAIIKEYEDVDITKISDYREKAGHGVSAIYEGKVIVAGNEKLMESENIDYIKTNKVGTVVYLAVDGKFMGTIIVADTIKEDAAQTITELEKSGIKNIIMLTGDNEAIAKDVAAKVGIRKYYASLLPDQKVEKLSQQVKEAKGKVMFVGDGINDAPVLVIADIGVSMGAIGSDAAIEASDVVLMQDQPLKILEAIKIAKATKVIVWQNIILSMTVKILFLGLATFGVATMWEGVFADVGVSLLAILNSMRILQKGRM
ncbi:MAG: heavy metal translocating P-type ATPase [Culicoidibacterales bacterium]